MKAEENTLAAAQQGNDDSFQALIAPYQKGLRTYCYQMSGSMNDAEDLLQEVLLRAWKGLRGFEGRSSLRTWLYRVAANVCIDGLEKKERRVLPMELGGPSGREDAIGPPRFEVPWLDPCPADFYNAATRSPESVYDQRQSVRLAFMVSIQHLTAKQRAVILLHDVLGFQATEIGAFLDATSAAVHSALQRARAALSSRSVSAGSGTPSVQEAMLLEKYVQAWESADVDVLVALLLKDATLEMPPLPQWLKGAGAIGASISQMLFAQAGPGVFRLVPTEANGQPAFAAYQRDQASGELRPMALHVLELRDGHIASITAFLNPALLPVFGLPETMTL